MLSWVQSQVGGKSVLLQDENQVRPDLSLSKPVLRNVLWDPDVLIAMLEFIYRRIVFYSHWMQWLQATFLEKQSLAHAHKDGLHSKERRGRSYRDKGEVCSQKQQCPGQQGGNAPSPAWPGCLRAHWSDSSVIDGQGEGLGALDTALCRHDGCGETLLFPGGQVAPVRQRVQTIRS